MQWRIDVAPRAAEAIRALDPSLREEFIVRIDAISADPLARMSADRCHHSSRSALGYLSMALRLLPASECS